MGGEARVPDLSVSEAWAKFQDAAEHWDGSLHEKVVSARMRTRTSRLRLQRAHNHRFHPRSFVTRSYALDWVLRAYW